MLSKLKRAYTAAYTAAKLNPLSFTDAKNAAGFEFMDEKANLDIMGAIMTVVIAAVAMAVAALILATVEPEVVAAAGNDTTALATIQGIFDTTWAAVGMLPIVLIVIVAVVIIGAVMLLRDQ